MATGWGTRRPNKCVLNSCLGNIPHRMFGDICTLRELCELLLVALILAIVAIVTLGHALALIFLGR